MSYYMKRKYPIGAEFSKKGVDFCVWAPDHRFLELVIETERKKPRHYKMSRNKEGYFSLFVEELPEKTLYRFKLPNGNLCADPASRFQPQGPNGPSMVINPEYYWKDKNWKGIDAKGHVAYEMHIGTFTQEGTYEAAAKELPELADLGITLIEILPLNEFPGHFGWGYDGVNLFAPTHLYGPPTSLKAFIDIAHSLKIGVVLDVVYNHLGPEGNQMISFAKEYLSEKFSSDWGQAINFDSIPSRQFFLTNAIYWIQEYHFDGLRIDATPWFFCSTPQHILQELSKVVKKAGKKRKTIIIGENEPQDTNLLRPYHEGGYGFDMMWNDDFHHTAQVRLTGKREAYYTDYLGSPQEFISSIKYGFLYQGQYYDWQKKPRGTPHLHILPQTMMIFLENHDQVANSGHGMRLHKFCDPRNLKAMTALFILGPNTPLIFQGQEFNSNQPFYYFADHNPHISHLVRKGRRRELSQFPRVATEEARKALPNPENPLTFTRSKLNFKDRQTNHSIYQMYKDLIFLRKNDPVIKKGQDLKVDGAVLGTDAFLLRYFGERLGDRLLIINFGADLYFNPAPEPLLVPSLKKEFEILWSSESLSYEGEGTPPINIPYWKILGHSAVLLKERKIDVS